MKKIINNRHLYIEFTIEKQIYHCIAFLDVIILGINNYNVTLETYHKSTYAELILNFKSFTSFPYKISLFKCLTGRLFKICDNWDSFHNDIEKFNPKLTLNLT